MRVNKIQIRLQNIQLKQIFYIKKNSELLIKILIIYTFIKLFNKKMSKYNQKMKKKNLIMILLLIKKKIRLLIKILKFTNKILKVNLVKY